MSFIWSGKGQSSSSEVVLFRCWLVNYLNPSLLCHHLFATRQRSSSLRWWFTSWWSIDYGAVVVNRGSNVCPVGLAAIVAIQSVPGTNASTVIVIDTVIPISRQVLQWIDLIIDGHRCVTTNWKSSFRPWFRVRAWTDGSLLLGERLISYFWMACPTHQVTIRPRWIVLFSETCVIKGWRRFECAWRGTRPCRWAPLRQRRTGIRWTKFDGRFNGRWKWKRSL